MFLVCFRSVKFVLFLYLQSNSLMEFSHHHSFFSPSKFTLSSKGKEIKSISVIKLNHKQFQNEKNQWLNIQFYYKQTQQKTNILHNILNSCELQHIKVRIILYLLPHFIHLFEDGMLSKIRVQFPTFTIKTSKSNKET